MSFLAFGVISFGYKGARSAKAAARGSNGATCPDVPHELASWWCVGCYCCLKVLPSMLLLYVVQGRLCVIP